MGAMVRRLEVLENITINPRHPLSLTLLYAHALLYIWNMYDNIATKTTNNSSNDDTNGENT